MSNSTRHTLRNLFSALIVLAAGLFVVALATRGLVQGASGADALAGVTPVSTGAAQPTPASPSAPPLPGRTPVLPAPAKTHVLLVIDYGDGVQKHFTGIEHKPGMTAMDAILFAKSHARGIKLDSTGKGETAFITAIDDLKNEGSGKDKKNWQFFINDEFATRGPGATPLKPGDTVRWVYDKWLGK